MSFKRPVFAASPRPAGDEAHRVVISGGGLIGLTLALDLAKRGIASVLLEADDTVCTGSRAICMAQRSLEIYDRLGLGERMLAKGVTWNTGRVYFDEREVFSFDLQPEPGFQFPAFVNLQQYYVEAWLVEACQATGLVDLRWRHEVTAVENKPDGVELTVKTADGPYRIATEWLFAADGAHSLVRRALDLSLNGREFHEQFLITDVVTKADLPTERRFWFDPPFHDGKSALLHKQPDDMWRVDLQLPPDADAKREVEPERVRKRVKAVLGAGVEFDLKWVSVYHFRCARLDRFVHGRTIFVGDSAHLMSPFGARGGNGGTQDVDNLAWKVAAVLNGDAPAALIASYDEERLPAADENILNSTRSTEFITPKSPIAEAYRDAVLEQAACHAFARPFVNSGRLSKPAHVPGSSLNTRDQGDWDGGVAPGSPALDAPIEVDDRTDWLLRQLGDGFVLLAWGEGVEVPGVRTLRVSRDVTDAAGLLAERYQPPAGAAILFRPDQIVAARFVKPTVAAVASARERALAHPISQRMVEP